MSGQAHLIDSVKMTFIVLKDYLFLIPHISLFLIILLIGSTITANHGKEFLMKLMCPAKFHVCLALLVRQLQMMCQFETSIVDSHLLQARN